MVENMKQNKHYMRYAIALAKRGVGRTAPNPSVGCVLVKDGQVIAQGWTADGGRPHAEQVALANASSNAKGATAYVTLEPCSHIGKTSSCADMLIKAGVKKVIYACSDHDTRVDGKGDAMLRKAGIEVASGVLEAEALENHKGFFKRIKHDLPYVTLKTATSLDGKITYGNDDSKWITNAKSREYGHLLRAKNDVIITGIGTVLADNPTLNCRLSGLENASPVRVVLDSKLRLPIGSNLVKTTKDYRTMVFCNESLSDKSKIKNLQNLGVEVFAVSTDDMSLKNILQKLAKLGFNDVMVEAGNQLNTSFIAEDLVDEICWFKAGFEIGEDGLSAFSGDAMSKIQENYSRKTIKKLDDDVLEVYKL